ncbi:hypothetical protein MMC11_000012 [Xylographa trunciseda]|nr:hypothetical protein [Xylographa trunciseda]
MDPSLAELSRLAHNAATTLDEAPPPPKSPQRHDPTGLRVPDTLWSHVQPSASAAGYDREAYEHLLQLGRPPTSATTPTSHHPTPRDTSSTGGSYLIKLDGPLASPSALQTAAHLSTAPPLLHGDGHASSARFNLLDAPARHALATWLSHHAPSFRPTIIRCSLARKALCAASAHPTLGIDATLPQHRPARAAARRRASTPCGTSSTARWRSRGCWLRGWGWRAGDKAPVLLREVRVWGGVLRMWGGKYRALVDGPAEAEVRGWAGEVSGEEEELGLRVYETERYEVVRCGIEVGGEVVRGCTFRWVGGEGELG